MGLRVVAVFLSLAEAQVARGALRSAGMDAVLFDELLGANMWTYQVAFGGFRLAVPENELEPANAVLIEINRRRFRRRDLGDRGVGWRWLAAFAGLCLAPDFGWLIVGLRQRGFASRVAGVTLSCLLVTGIGVGLTLFGLLIFDLSHPP
jgi:hypothetical protein